MRLVVLLGLLVLLVQALGCVEEDPPIPECKLGCGPAGLCPGDWVCWEDGICHAPGDDNTDLCAEAILDAVPAADAAPTSASGLQLASERR
jgi:hypothetical protein